MLVCLLIVGLAYLVFSKFIRPVLYWKKKNIFYVTPWKGFLRVLFGPKSFFELIVEAYRRFPEKRYYGSYQFLNPSLFVTDLDLIKQITVKDFEYFPDHFSFVNRKSDPILGQNLFALEGERWKDMRSTLSPAFTSSKMKAMYTLIQETAESFTDHFYNQPENTIELEIKEAYSKFTNDIIATCAFGVQCNSLKNDKNDFFTMGSRMTKPTGLNVIKGILAAFFPHVFEFFRIPIFPSFVTKFFQDLIKETISVREKNNIIRPDMIHLLMEARKGRLQHETISSFYQDTGFATVEESSLGKSGKKMELTDDLITAQALVFFFAGFDTSSTLLSFLSYHLAVDQKIQTTLQKEIDNVTKLGDGRVSYEELLKMKYLDQVISETLRRYPPGFMLTRICVKDYKIEAKRNDEVDFVLDKGTLVGIPVAGIHLDPRYFPDPEKFDPDRFGEENKANIIPGSFLPFGSGPRNCIVLYQFMLQLTLGVAIVAALYYFICVKPMRYWKNRGIQQTNPIWLFGDSWSTLMRQESTSDQAVRCYNQFPGVRYFGWYQFSLPTLMINDPELIKQITVKDFDHFTDHRSFFPEDVEPLWSKNLFALTGKKWRDMRPILSPTFTSSKMRTMFLLISDCSEKFVKHFVENNENCIEIEMKDIFTRFTNDVIATTAFGVEVDSLKQPNNEFYLMGKEVTNFTGFWRLLKIFGYFIIPSVYHFFRISVSPFTKKISMFFRELVDDTIKFREENNIIRPDMIHLLMESRKGIEHKEENVDIGTGFATVEESFMGKGISGKEITNTDITAQALIFFFAGFEQVSSLMCFMALELALHDNVQTRLREEIKKTISSCGGNLTYEALMKMKYMDMVVSETLRKWPTTVLTDRICTKAYIIEPQNPGEQPLHLERNANITIPMFAIHRDPKYYPDPDRFDPERFNDENKLKINPYTYAPFGFGPRNCIGSRFALLETKLIFFHLLSHFELVPVKKTCTPLRASKKSFNLVADGGFWVGMRELTKSMKSTLSTHT